MMGPMSLRTSEYKHIALDDKGRPVPSGMPRFKVRDLVMAYLAYQGTAEELAREYDGLTPAQVHGALTYYHDHQAEIDTDIQRVRELDEEIDRRQQDDPVIQKLKKLKASRSR